MRTDIAQPDLSRCCVVAVSAGRLWRESLERLFADTCFTLHPASDQFLVEPPTDILAAQQPVILLYRDHSATGQCVAWIDAMRARHSAAKIVVIVNRLRISLLARAMQAGADGFLTEDMSGLALVRSLELVTTGERVLPGVLGEFIARQGISPLFREESPAPGLSPRDSDILKRLAQGQSNKVIANALAISESTVKGSVKTILKKIAAQNRTQAAVWALNEGLLLAEPEPPEPSKLE